MKIDLQTPFCTAKVSLWKDLETRKLTILIEGNGLEIKVARKTKTFNFDARLTESSQPDGGKYQGWETIQSALDISGHDADDYFEKMPSKGYEIIRESIIPHIIPLVDNLRNRKLAHIEALATKQANIAKEMTKMEAALEKLAAERSRIEQELTEITLKPEIIATIAIPKTISDIMPRLEDDQNLEGWAEIILNKS